MSRIIKFRGKRIDNGEWVYGYYWCNEEAGNFHKGRHFIRSMNFQPAEFDYTDYEVIPKTVGQFTGLFDKNGKDPVEFKQLEEENERLQAENERLEDVLVKIDNWAKAYPLKVFPEPDFKKAAEVLKAAGLTLDAISASNMRHVISGIKDMVGKALQEKSND